MKLLKLAGCQFPASGGNVKELTVIGDTSVEGFSDAGSTPASSTSGKSYIL